MLAMYARVSSPDQEKNENIKYQIDCFKVFVKEKAIKDYEIYKDDGISGGYDDIGKRPDLLRLLNDIKAKKVSGLWIFAYDRLARNNEVQAVVISQLKKSKIDFYLKGQLIDLDIPINEVQAMMMGAFAVYEKQTIKIRTRLGMDKVKNEGLFPKGNLYGYVKTGKDKETGRNIYKQVPDEIERMKQIYQAYIDGKSIHQLAKKWRVKNGRQFFERVRYPEYMGKTYDSKGKEGGTLIPSKLYPAIVSEEDWNKAQAILAINGDYVKRTMKKSNYRGAGLLRCFFCKNKYYISTTPKKSGKKYYYYKHNMLNISSASCDTRSNQLTKDDFETILDFTYCFHFSLMTNFTYLLQIERNMYKNKMEDANDLVIQLRKKINKLELEKKRLFKAIEEGISAKEVKPRIDEKTEEIAEINKAIKSTFTTIDAEKVVYDKQIEMENKYRKSNYFKKSEKEKRETLMDFILSAYIKYETVVISTAINRHYVFNKKNIPIMKQLLKEFQSGKRDAIWDDWDEKDDDYKLLNTYRLYWGEQSPFDGDFTRTNIDATIQKMITTNTMYRLVIWDFREEKLS